MGPPPKRGNGDPDSGGGKARACLRSGGRGPWIPQSPGAVFSPREMAKAEGRADREVWTQRQQTAGEGRELGERQANKETNKQRARQTKGPSARDRPTSEKKPTERHWSCASQAGQQKGPVGLCQSGSLLEAQGLWGCLLAVSAYPFSQVCLFSIPRPFPISLPVRPIPAALSISGHLSALPLTLPLREIQMLPVGFGGQLRELGLSSRDEPEGSSQACRKERQEHLGLCPQVSRGSASEAGGAPQGR